MRTDPYQNKYAAAALWEKQVPLTAEHYAMGLKRVNPNFKWSDYDPSSFTVTEWQERDGWLTYQGMKHKKSGAPHGVVKLTV